MVNSNQYHFVGVGFKMADQQELLLDFEKTLVPGSIKKAMHDAGAKSRDLWQVEVGQIRVMPNFNVRAKNDAYVAHIRSLANLILAEGFRQDKPLAGYVAKEGDDNVIYIHDGHCRLEAVKLAIAEGAEIVTLPVVVTGSGLSLEDLTVGLVTGNSGKPLSTFEVAVVCKRLSGYNWDASQIAKRLDFTEPYVNDLLFLMAAPRQIRDMVQAEQVSASHAVDMLRKHGDKALALLSDGLLRAQAAGKSKVTNKFVAGAAFKKAVRKQSSAMLGALRDVGRDPGFASLSQENQKKLADLLVLLDEAEKQDQLPDGDQAQEP